MTIAEKVKNIISTECPSTFSLCAGYGMRGGEYVRLPAGVQMQDKRNANGRCIRAVYKYADDSSLIYSYSTKTETYTLKVN